MTPQARSRPPLKQMFGDLRVDAQRWLETVQTAAQRLMHPARSGGRPGKAAPAVKSTPPRIDRALQDHRTHELEALQRDHQQFLERIRMLAAPLDELLASLARDHIRTDGAAAQDEVWLVDATRDWLRRLYGLEQLEKAMHDFYSAEICLRSARIGLELAGPPGEIVAAEAEGNRLNRRGLEALFHLRDHLLEQSEALTPSLPAHEDSYTGEEATAFLGRAAVSRTLGAALDDHDIVDERRYILERRLEALSLPPVDESVESSLEQLIELVEILGAQRQSRDRGWHPEEPQRGVHATATGLWLLYSQIAACLVFAVCAESGAEELAPHRIAGSLREGLFELLAGFSSRMSQLQLRLSPE